MTLKFKETEIGLIPEDWEVETFSEVVNVNPRRTLKKGEEVKFVSMSDLKEFDKKVQDYVFKKYSGGSKFKNEDTLIARITPSLENGKTAFMDVLDDDEIAAGSTEFIVLSAKPNKTNPHYVFYLSISQKLRDKLIKSMTGTSGRQRVDNNVFNQIEIPLPPLKEQEEISDFLLHIDSKIELNQRMNHTLEEIGSAIFKHWFVDFEFPDEQGRPYKSSGGEMVDSELGKIPKAWYLCNLKDYVGEIIDNRGKTPPLTSKGIKLLESYQVFRDKPFPDFSKESKQKHVTKDTYNNWFRSGHPQYLDILFATVGTIPNWCFVPKKCDFCIAQNIIAIRTKKDNSSFYLKYTFDLHYFLEQFNGRIIETVQPSIRVKDLMEIKILNPPINILNKFDVVIGDLYKEINLNNQIAENLIRFRDSLLPKLMSGKIRVKGDE